MFVDLILNSPKLIVHVSKFVLCSKRKCWLKSGYFWKYLFIIEFLPCWFFGSLTLFEYLAEKYTQSFSFRSRNCLNRLWRKLFDHVQKRLDQEDKDFAIQFLHDCHLQWSSYLKSFSLNSCTFPIFSALDIKKLVLVGKILWRFNKALHLWLIYFLFH